MPAGEGRGKETVGEFAMNMYTLLRLNWVTNKVLLYSTGNCIPYLMINRNGKKI